MDNQAPIEAQNESMIPNAVPAPVPEITPPSQTSDVKFKIIIGIMTIVILSLIGYIAVIAQKPTNTTLPKGDHAILAEETPMKDELSTAPTAVQNNTIESAMSLYGVTPTLPTGWTVTETNRRPEPAEDELFEKYDHECVDYIIQDPSQSISLNIQFVCGYADGAGLPLPEGSVKITENNDKGIARISEYGTVSYIEFSPVEISDLNGTRTEIWYGRFLNFISSSEESLTGTIDVEYVGDTARNNELISQADTIVLSIIKQP